MMLSRFVQNSGFSLIKFQPRLQNANLNNSKLLYSLKTKACAFKVEIYLSFSYKTKKIYKHDRLMSITMIHCNNPMIIFTTFFILIFNN